MNLDLILWLAVAAGVIAALYGWLETQSITKASAGNDRMKEIAAAIQEGARAYLNRQYSTIAMVGAGAVVVLGIAFWPVWQ
ncbi:MAG: sodium/proton-translocating pyrophosphatase, partial [Proteobacteria bacterium]|nr:sodium/proton-translocating pyrophosphatase [Pseudomonadota bacterium]